MKASNRETPPKMRSPLRHGVDDTVDRSEVEAWQHVKLTDTNLPKA